MAFDNYTIRYFIKDHGLPAILRKKSRSSYNATTGTVSETNTDYRTYGYSYKSVPTQLQENSTVLSTRKVIISNLQTNHKVLPTPKAGDQVIINSFTYDIVSVSEVRSASSVVCYTLDVKG